MNAMLFNALCIVLFGFSIEYFSLNGLLAVEFYLKLKCV